jgi:hypothetical protein
MTRQVPFFSMVGHHLELGIAVDAQHPEARLAEVEARHAAVIW